ncbi:MAG TPA: PH domain-containing protein [Nocardioidaceae bacterium]|nr:PH domain-containing protein [Nocardioidaceae bacterium]
MGISPRLLGDGERVVISTRTHSKALVGPILVFIVICALAGFLAALVPPDLAWLRWIVAAIAVAAGVAWVLTPLLRWLTTSYTVTNHRLITRRGVFTRLGHDLPLSRVHDVSYERSLLDRLFGCGTLVVSAASEDGQIRLTDVPNVEHLHLRVSGLLISDRDGVEGSAASYGQDVDRR